MEQGGYLNEDADISDFTEVNLSVPSFSHPGCLVRLLGPIIFILLSTVDRLGYEFPVSNPITAQLVRHDFSGFATM